MAENKVYALAYEPKKKNKPLRIADSELKLIQFLENTVKKQAFPIDLFFDPDINYYCEAEKVMLKYFQIHNIPYCLKTTIDQIVEDYASEKLSKQEAIKKFYELIGTINPYNIPKTYTFNHLNSATGVSSIKIKGRLKLYAYTNIRMPLTPSLLVGPIYNHEIMHTQVSDSGYVTDIQNNEILSMFIENITSLEMDSSGNLYSYFRKMRMEQLLDNIKYTIKASNNLAYDAKVSSFIVSELKASHLFSLYLESNSEQKQHIIYLIQSVIDGKITLEKMLKKLEITYKNSCNTDILKRTLNL